MIVTSVRKDKKGCKIGETWYNFAPQVIEFVKDKELWKADVDIETSSDGKFINKITINTAAPTQEKEGSAKDGYWFRREERDLLNSARISRHGAINTAVEILKTSNMVSAGKEIPPLDVLGHAETLAEAILKFVTKNE